MSSFDEVSEIAFSRVGIQSVEPDVRFEIDAQGISEQVHDRWILARVLSSRYNYIRLIAPNVDYFAPVLCPPGRQGTHHSK